MKHAALRFSLFYSAPVLILLVPPALVLFSLVVLTGFLAIFDPSTPLNSVLPLGLWSLIPLFLSFLFISGGGWIFQSGSSGKLIWSFQVSLRLMMGIFLFLALWFDITLLGSISASDKKPLVYLGASALLAGAATLLGAAGIPFWTRFVLTKFPPLVYREETNDPGIS
jgi:hypothetical protein